MEVAVVGGGVAGAAAAIGLRRIGADVTVYEAHHDPAGTVGSFVSLAANGLRGLDALGCLQQCQDAGFPVLRQRMWSGGGKLLGDVPRGRRANDSLHSVTLMRADLVGVLRAEAVRSGARIVTGARVTSPDDERLRDADLVVGADGISSTVRGTLDPQAPKPRYAGLCTVSGVSDQSAAGFSETGFADPGTFNMTFGRTATFIAITAPDGSIWWSAQIPSTTAPDPRAIGIAELAVLFKRERHVLRILDAARAETTGTLNHVMSQVSCRRSDRAVLIGDAAHPVGAGQGASMAIEDAVVLAGSLARTPSVPAALTAFDDARHERLVKMVRSATANRDAKTAGRVSAALRTVIMPITFSRFYEMATGWLYDYDPGSLPTRTR